MSDLVCPQGCTRCRTDAELMAELESRPILRLDTQENRDFWLFVARLSETLRHHRPSWALPLCDNAECPVGCPDSHAIDFEASR